MDKVMKPQKISVTSTTAVCTTSCDDDDAVKQCESCDATDAVLFHSHDKTCLRTALIAAVITSRSLQGGPKKRYPNFIFAITSVNVHRF